MGMVTDLVRVSDSAVITTEEGSYPMEAAPFAGEGMRVSLEEKKEKRPLKRRRAFAGACVRTRFMTGHLFMGAITGTTHMKTYLIRPGIWFRPLLDRSAKIPAAWRLQRDKSVLDISVPQVLDFIKKDVDRIAQWGYELVKHDFSTYDLLGRWGFQMGSELTEGGWRFWDKGRTTAEIIREFYAAIYEAAGDMLILGCNCIGHLGAGLMQLNRTGDDTSGIEWERTRKMGINTLAFRMPQQDAFFGADADCVGITDKIEWELNRQWMELLAISGTPFFVSVQPGLLEHAQEEQLQEAYRMAAKNRAVAVPMDWKKEQIPRKWMTMEGEKEFFWQKGEEVK